MLGAAVVKTACKIWLQDHAIAADATVGVVDIIQSKVAGTREQRRVSRLFEDLEERVADNVLSGMDVEFANVPANEREAAVLAVADTFDKARLTNRDLFAADLSAPRLQRMVGRFGPRFTRDLSAGATALYDRVLSDCCAYIVEVADVLPGFKVGVFSELLTRQNEILRLVDQRFERLPMQLGGAGAETFEPTYLRLVAKQLDKIELFGVTVSDRVGSYPLSVAYVSLSLASSARREELSRVTSIEDALGGTRRAFIRGEAGSGKTTLLQWLAVRCAVRDLAGPMRGWHDSVPLFIRLRRYSGMELPTPEEFLRDVGKNLAQPMGWVQHLLTTGRAVLLVDGVDELPETQRRRAREWLRELLLTYPRARYVVTSRPAAAEESWLDDDGFDVLEIQPMTVADIDAFVTHWHAAMSDGVNDPVELERIETSRQELTKTIRNRRHLRMLAVNPLMTALVCALHLDRRMQLPHDRTELYSIALEMLLERRDSERAIRASNVVITRADKMIILADLAYWLVRNGWSNASQERVVERLAHKLRDLHRVSATPEEMLRHLLDRSGLLRMPVEGQIDFVHKTFQEFLAARAAVASDDIGLLAQNAHDDQWREVVLMAVSHARPQQTEELLNQLLTKANRTRDLRYVLQALALGCIEHAPQLSPELLARLATVATTLLPPKRMDTATALVGAGDLVLELLSEHKNYRADEAVATIRMAAAIGGPLALSIIGECARTGGLGVMDELARAWREFEPRDFAERILARTELAKKITIADPSLLAGLRHLRLRSLSCRFPHGYGDVAYLAELPLLTYFTLHDPKLRGLAPVADHPRLRTLNLRHGTAPVDVSVVGRCMSLRQLDLTLDGIADPWQLREVSQIRVLEIRDAAGAADILPYLADDLRLARLALWRAEAMGDLSGLVSAPQLSDVEVLLLGNARSLTSIAEIERWSNTIRRVFLEANRLVDVERLAALTRLEFANLAGTPIASLEFVRELHELGDLRLGEAHSSVPDLTPLCAVPALRNLRIVGDGPVDLSGLAGAANLTVHIEGAPTRTIVGQDKLPASVVVST